MTEAQSTFLKHKLYFKTYLVWHGSPKVWQWELARAKRDVEIARAFMNVERRKAHENTFGN